MTGETFNHLLSVQGVSSVYVQSGRMAFSGEMDDNITTVIELLDNNRWVIGGSCRVIDSRGN